MITAGITKTTARAVLIVSVLGVAYLAANVQGDSSGITFATENGFNLTIDSHALYNGALVPGSTWDLKNLVPSSDKFFNFGDVKPGDYGEAIISLHVNKNAWMCLDFNNLQNQENGINEPESHADATPNSGELAGGMEFFAWRDDGDDVFEVGEVPIFGTGVQSASVVLNNKKYTLADPTSPSPLTASTTAYVGITWCAGNLGVNLATAAISCDAAALGNVAQTDSMSVDISFRAVTTDQTDFRCEDSSGGSSTGLGGEIGRFVKCKTLAKMGWPLPRYEAECPAGFNTSESVQPLPRSGSTRTR